MDLHATPLPLSPLSAFEGGEAEEDEDGEGSGRKVGAGGGGRAKRMAQVAEGFDKEAAAVVIAKLAAHKVRWRG